MAEAHQAVALKFTITHEGKIDLDVNHEMLKEIYQTGRRTWIKKLKRLQNRMHRNTYPVSPATWLAVLTAVLACVYAQMDPSMGLIEIIRSNLLPSSFNKLTGTFISSFLFASFLWLGIIIFLRYSLKALLYYKGYMYEPRGRTSWSTTIWMAVMKTFCAKKPGLYSYQGSLPNMPVPALKDTTARYLKSVRGLLEDDEYDRISKLAKEFEDTVGPRFQRYLYLKWLWSTNYVSDWWEEYVYLRGRSPIMVNSNYYGMDTITCQLSYIQAARAANCVVALLQFRKLLDREDVKPIMGAGTVPLCSWQYERVFNTTRLPGIETDRNVHLNDSRHIAVLNRGRFYKVPLQLNGSTLEPCDLEKIFTSILEDTYEPTEAELHLPALTAGERTPWASARKRFFSSGCNKTSLDVIEGAAFVLVLDTEEYDYNEKNFNLDDYGKALLHGKCYDRWFDKSFNLVVFTNGRIGCNAEHSYADAPIVAHLYEEAMSNDKSMGYNDDGHCKGVSTKNLPQLNRLKWDIPEELHGIIEESYSVAKKIADDLDLHILIHNNFGKGAMKKCKVSPDAFIQNSMQLAFRREAGKNCLTYESCMTRLFREGRTETVRPCTVESVNFCKAMDDPNVSVEEKIALFKAATDVHVKSYCDAMCGKGVDRHLFTLYVVSRYLEVDSPFLKEVLSQPWQLSTSQTPATQTNRVDLKKYPYYSSAGGGFGPVADNGYGVSYIITGEDNIFFHVSCKKSCPTTDAARFADNIKKALADVLALFN
ncbi:carnitine O-palmitoyltransferase 1, liver isoform-like isoform X2 [Apostichopus japonicus]|uniref:carnitine O-palmitoyltransferase 1, liver isoform-like isoform X2 n=1 Tax=Stichopus japonicus TaxID=307972 RepID=UPI003AB43FC6